MQEQRCDLDESLMSLSEYLAAAISFRDADRATRGVREDEHVVYVSDGTVIRGKVCLVQRIGLLNKVTWSEDLDGKTSGLDSLGCSQNVAPVQRQKELTGSLDGCCQHMEVLGIDERSIVL